MVALAYNLQLIETEGRGFIHLDGIAFADGASSTIAWDENADRSSNSGFPYVVASEFDPEDNRGEIGLFLGGSGSAHVIIDITGYYIPTRRQAA